MYESHTAHLERSPTAPSLTSQTAGLVPAPDRRGPRGQRRTRQSVDETRQRRRRGSASPSAITWCPVPIDRRATCPPTDAAAAGPRRLWLPGRALDTGPHRRGDSPHVWHLVPSHPDRPRVQGHPLEPTKAGPSRPPARRSRDCPVARGEVARDQKGAQAQQQTILFIDESGFDPLPGVVRTSAPIGQTPILRDWCTRDHLSALSAISPEGKR